MARGRGRAWRDALVPLLLGAVAVVEALSSRPESLGRVVLVEVAACAALVPRRTHALWGAAVALALLVGLASTGPAVDELGAPLLVILLAAFSLGRWVPGLRGLLVLVPAYVVVVLGPERSDRAGLDVTDLVFVGAVLCSPYAFGWGARTLAERGARVAEQAALLARLQETVRDDAVSAERTRIARELHDVLAHSISAMVVQASAGEELLRRDPDRAARAMRQVADTGRQALAETGRLLALVRDVDGELGTAPDPGLRQLDELVGQFRRSGLQVDLDVDGDLRHLPVGVDLSAYRVVQEALTNALRHGADRRVRLHVERSGSELRIAASNPGRAGPSDGSGLGLVGMAERASLLGGSLRTRVARDGTFQLQVVLPLETVDV